MIDYDTVVIGAGAAGLMAGMELAQRGQRVAIVEARTHVGGRICTHHAEVPLELGAEFIHGLPEATWSLVRAAALSTMQLSGAPFRYQEEKLRPAHDEAAGAFETLGRMAHWLEGQAPGTDLSFEKYLGVAGIAGSQAERARQYVEGFNAADGRRISIAALARQQQAEDAIQADQLFHLTQGYDALPRFLLAAFEHAGGIMRLNHRVRVVDWCRDRVVIRAADKAPLTARRLIITVPLGVLKSGDVSFAPDVPGLAAHISGLEMGPVLRLALLFRQPFWASSAPGMLFLFSSGQLIPTWWTSHPDAAPRLTGWIGGATATARAQGLRGEALIDAALIQLTRMFGMRPGALRRLLLTAEVHDWMQDPLARGAYSYAAVDGVNASTSLARPVEATLFFAGEHTDVDGHWGTVHAALASGRRAAEQILSSA